MDTLLHRRLHFRSAGWTLPENCVAWLSSTKSGNVAKLGTWSDQSGNAKSSLVLKGDAAVTGGTGLALDGNGDYGSASPDWDISGSNTNSLCAWVYITAWSPSGSAYIGDVVQWGRVDSDHQGVQLRIGQSTDGTKQRPMALFYSTTYRTASSSTDLSLNTWYHIAVIHTSTRLSLYVDGTEVAGTNTTDAAKSGQTAWFSVGRDYPYTRYLTGTVDEVMMFSRAISTTELDGIRGNQYKKK